MNVQSIRNNQSVLFQKGYYREAGGNPEIILADGNREILDSEFNVLKSAATPTATELCSVLHASSNEVLWKGCTDTHRFLCEYKGNK